MALQSTSDAVAAYNSKLTQVGPRALIYAVVTMGGATLLVALLFNILRGKNETVYSTRMKYSATPIVMESETSKTKLFSWIGVVFNAKEVELLELGLDTVVFLRFMRMISWSLTVIALVCGGALIPINVVYNFNNVPESKRSALSMLTIQDVKGNILFIHMGVSYVVNLILLCIIWHNYRKVTTLRKIWFRSPNYLNHLYSRTLSVIRIPPDNQSDSKFSTLVSSLSLPNVATSSQIGRDIGDLPKLINEHNDAVVSLENALAKYLKGGRLAKSRPTTKLKSFYGLGGEKVDAITHYTEEVKRLETIIVDRREQLDMEDSKPTNYGFITMASAPLAHRNARYVDRNEKKLRTALLGAKVSSAPCPEDIIWSNIQMTEKEQDPKRIVAGLLLFIACAFFTLPVLVISFLANLTTISTFIPFLQTWQHNSLGTFSAVSGILPPIVSAIFAMLIPIIIRAVSKLQGISTRTELARVVCARYFDFLFVSQLILFSLISVLFNLCVSVILQIGKGQSLSSVFQNLSSVPGTISSTYLVESTYWISFAPARGFSAVFDLAQLINLVTITIRNKLTGKRRTPREARNWSKPQPFAFEIYTANLLFLVTVGLTYASLAPLVVIAIAIVLWIWYAVYKYQLMFVYSTAIESGGRLWPIMIDRLLVSLAFSNLLLALTIALARSWIYFVVLAPPTVLILIFKIYLKLQYSDKFLYFVPSKEIEEIDVPNYTGDERKGRLRRFEHPALHSELFTPMVDANLTHLLPEVYGKTETVTPTEDGDNLLTTVMVGEGLKIATVEESQIEVHEEGDSISVGSISEDEGTRLEETIRRKKEKAKEMVEKWKLPFSKVKSI